MIQLATVLCFMGAGLAFYGILIPHEWRQSLAVASSVISLMGLCWNAFPELFNKIGAIAAYVTVLVALLWAHWPPADIAASL